MDVFSALLGALLLGADPAPVSLPPVEVPAPPGPAAPPPPDSAARRDPSGSVTVIRVADRPARLLVAAYVGATRLIDNLELREPSE